MKVTDTSNFVIYKISCQLPLRCDSSDVKCEGQPNWTAPVMKRGSNSLVDLRHGKMERSNSCVSIDIHFCLFQHRWGRGMISSQSYKCFQNTIVLYTGILPIMMIYVFLSLYNKPSLTESKSPMKAAPKVYDLQRRYQQQQQQQQQQQLFNLS